MATSLPNSDLHSNRLLFVWMPCTRCKLCHFCFDLTLTTASSLSSRKIRIKVCSLSEAKSALVIDATGAVARTYSQEWIKMYVELLNVSQGGALLGLGFNTGESGYFMVFRRLTSRSPSCYGR